MTDFTITAARDQLASVIDHVRSEPVFLTKHGRQVAAIVDAEHLHQLLEDAEELADIRAVDAALEEMKATGAAPIPWEEVKRDLGLL